MKAVPLLLLLAVASPAFAQTPAEKPSAPADDPYGPGKVFLYDGVAARLKDFSPPDSVIIGSSPVDKAPVRPPTPKAPVAPAVVPPPPYHIPYLDPDRT